MRARFLRLINDVNPELGRASRRAGVSGVHSINHTYGRVSRVSRSYQVFAICDIIILRAQPLSMKLIPDPQTANDVATYLRTSTKRLAAAARALLILRVWPRGFA